MEQDDEKITLMLSMGFPDVNEITRALRLSKWDISDAVSMLTEQPMSSYNTVEDLRDVDMTDASAINSLDPPSYDQRSPKADNSLEFPTTHLYELESRLFIESWVIPYKKEESLGLCLSASIKLAEEGLSEADENCQRFFDRCLPDCFQKLCNSVAVRRWNSDIQEGIFSMIELLLDLVVARLKNGTIPEEMLRSSFSMIFDQEIEWHQKNKNKHPEFKCNLTYAECINTHYETFGWLVDTINMFGTRGGYETIAHLFEEKNLDEGQMAGLFVPVASVVKFLSKDIFAPMFRPAVEKAIKYIMALEDHHLKAKRMKYCYQLLEYIRVMCVHFWPNDVGRVTDLHLHMIIRMLKTPHFSSRMIALKELGILINNSEKRNSNGMDCDFIQDWMTEKAVLSLALEGNLDQVQYTDRMKQLMEFMGPKMKEEDLSKIWGLCDKASPHVMDNIHRVMVAAATRFNPHQFDHLLKLIRKSWETGNDNRLREKLLSLIGRIGQDSRLGKTTEKMLDTLWELARVSSLPRELVHLAIDEHLHILNESANREQMRKTYIIRCVEDIKRSPAVYLPLKQLHHLSKSLTRKNASYFNKSDKATLSDLNRSHEIVKLITQSIGKCHSLAVQASKGEPPDPEILIDGKYTLANYVLSHLEFLQFLLKEGDIYLDWPRCKELWDTLISNEKASIKDQEVCLEFFRCCLSDLEPNTQRDLFNERLLSMDTATLNFSSFGCFVEFFQTVNLNDRKIIKTQGNLLADSLELNGLDFIWEIVLECNDQTLAEEAIRLLLDMSYLTLTSRLKKDRPTLHQRFISECYKKLEQSLLHVNQQSSSSGTTVNNTPTKSSLTAMAVSEIASLSPSSKRTCLQHIHRILIIVERYISSIEALYTDQRTILPHAACFSGKPMVLTIKDETSSNQMTLQCHGNENLGSIYQKIVQGACIKPEQLQQISFEREFSGSDNSEDKYLVMTCFEQENTLLHQLFLPLNATATVKINSNIGPQLKEVNKKEIWSELPDFEIYNDNHEESPNSSSSTKCNLTQSTSSTNTMSAAAEAKLREEKKLPGVVTAAFGKSVFNMLYELALLEDNKILEAVSHVLYLIPTDCLISDKFDSLCSGSLTVASSMISSPANSPSKTEKSSEKNKKKEFNLRMLKILMEINMKDVTPFRLLYNLEVLSCKLMPLAENNPRVQNNNYFCEEFLACGGLNLLTNLLRRDSLPQETNYEIRQNIYILVLQLLSFLLCNSNVSIETPMLNLESSPYPPKRSALDSSQLMKVDCPLECASQIAIKTLENLSNEEWLETVSDVMRVTWASAAGKLFLCSTGMSSIDNSISSPESFKSSRDNSTSSGHSSGSESEKSFQGGICMQRTTVGSTDTLIAVLALPLLVSMLSLKPNAIDKWYNLSGVKDFIIEMLIGCSCQDVREKACQQFFQLSKLQSSIAPSPGQFLTQVLHKARLPLWVSSTSARGATLRYITQCSQYFDISSRLLSNLSQSDQDLLNIISTQMTEDEINWLTNFTATREMNRLRPESGTISLRQAENILVAGHLSLITALLSCESVNKEKCGELLIPLLLNEYLFPASKLVLEYGPLSDLHEESRNCSAKCTGKDARLSAYRLLAQLSLTSEKNFSCLCQYLIRLHHKLNPDGLKEYEHNPVVDGRCSSGYVGLKNGGATCYMNSVLQQLFLVPGVCEDVLGINSDEDEEETLFYELQSVFGHLLESQLQYFTPEKFWKCFQMGDQPVNIREQQDAFEFYSRLTEQIDDHLKKIKQDSIFARRFEGVYSIQRICQDCPHRYEREETFLALNLTVTKCNDLQDSLEQFIKGEKLEGDNAYYCEKCNKKRTAIMRTCIKTLPSNLVIQLKRFGYDWEASRALKFDDYYKFPWFIDMGDYTAEALSDRDIMQSPAKDRETATMEPPQQQSSSFSSSKKKTPIKVSMPSPSFNKFSTPRKNCSSRHRYELVGVIVHSGQANAGHYYSYIKDRRADPISNPNKSKWFKFNDTTVTLVEMSYGLLEQECFGGSYKAKVSYDSSNPMPEDRLRYWNGYLLFYDRIDEIPSTPRTPKTPRLLSSSRSLRASTSSARKSLSLGINESRKLGSVSGSSSNSIDSLMTSPLLKNHQISNHRVRAAQTSLCELSELLQQGEKKGMFKQEMPPRILATISHENLTFLRNRDLYSEDYFAFIFNICQSVSELINNGNDTTTDCKNICVSAVSLGVRFLLNTYLRSRVREKSVIVKWMELLCSILGSVPATSRWALEYFTEEEGEKHLVPLLLDCPSKMVRHQFSTLLTHVLCAECRHTNGPESVKRFVKNLLGLLAVEAPSYVKSSNQYFQLLFNFCSQGSAECDLVLELGGFTVLISFLLGSAQSPKRRWSHMQTQDFGNLHNTIAVLISSCKFDALVQSMEESENCEKLFAPSIPPSIAEVIYGEQKELWLKEVVLAYREVMNCMPPLTEALTSVCTNNSSFSFSLITIIMNQYGIAPSNMLKQLSALLLDILLIDDNLNGNRILAVLSGYSNDNGVEIQGLLNVIEMNKENDSRRAYQCIKLIVSLAARSSIARDHLTNTQTNWQWSVEWLKSKMEDHTSLGFNANTYSNEDSNTKTFQRTTSAQWTLDEATALLSGIESVEMEIDCEHELAEIKESPETEIVSEDQRPAPAA